MKVILVIAVIALLMYVVLSVMMMTAEKEVIMKYDNLIWTKDNDGRKVARMRLNDVYSVHVMEFSEDGIPYYIVTVYMDGEYHQSIDYCTSDEVGDIMERLQTIGIKSKVDRNR